MKTHINDRIIVHSRVLPYTVDAMLYNVWGHLGLDDG